MEKFPFNSDYVDSYLNYILLSLSGTDVAQDAMAFKNCVYMNPMSLTLTNCADRRERVNHFIEEKKEKFDTLKSLVTTKCSKELMEAFLLDKNLSDERNKFTAHARLNLNEKLEEKLYQLSECIFKDYLNDQI